MLRVWKGKGRHSGQGGGRSSGGTKRHSGIRRSDALSGWWKERHCRLGSRRSDALLGCGRSDTLVAWWKERWSGQVVVEGAGGLEYRLYKNI